VQSWSRNRSILAAGLLAACALLGSTVYGELTAPPIAPAAALQPLTTPAAAAPNAPFAMPPLETYAEVTARPLFFPTRRPAPIQAATVDRVDAQSLVLVGVILAESGKAALIARANLPGARRVALGEEIEGWVLAEIDADRVVLRSGTTEAVLPLKDRRPNPTPPKPNAAPVTLPRP